MFWLIFRALILAAAGGLVVLIATTAASPIIDTMFEMTTHESSRNAYWSEQAINWLPAIVFGSIVIKVLAGATARRGTA